MILVFATDSIPFECFKLGIACPYSWICRINAVPVEP